MLYTLLSSPRETKRTVSILYDCLAIPLAILSAMALRYGEVSIHPPPSMLLAIGLTTAFTIAVFIRLGLYRAVIRYMTGKAFLSISIGICLSTFFLAASSFLLQAPFPRSSIIIYFYTGFMMVGLPRLLVRSLVHQIDAPDREEVLIFGTGEQGIALVNALLKANEYRPIAFIDEDKANVKSVISGLPVHHSGDLVSIREKYKHCKKLLLALDDNSRDTRQKLIRRLEPLQFEVLTTPSVNDIVTGKATIEEIREVSVDDLLERECVEPSPGLLANDI